jgi:hypothetical protein
MKNYRYLLIFIAVITILSACSERSKYPPIIPKGNEVKSISVIGRKIKVAWCIRDRNDIKKILEFLKTQKDNWFIWSKGNEMFSDFKDYPYAIIFSSYGDPNLLPQFRFGSSSLREIHGDTYRSVQVKSITPEEYSKLVELLHMDRPNQYPKGIKEGAFFTFCE